MIDKIILLSLAMISGTIANNDTTTISNSTKHQPCGDRQYCASGEYCKYHWPQSYQCLTPDQMCDNMTMEFALCACSYRCGDNTTIACQVSMCHPDCQCKSGYFVHTRIMDAMVCVTKDKCPQQLRPTQIISNNIIST
jgi:hypothetical protein